MSKSPPRGQTKIDEFVLESIEKLREKLLDLSRRNPLLSFKHSVRAPKYIRVIDEFPDDLSSRLAGSNGMKFKSLGKVPGEPEDEKTPEFRRALEKAKLEDAEYTEALESLGDDANERSLDGLERELRSRIRGQLGMPPRSGAILPSPCDVARNLGLDPSFDLSQPATGLRNILPARRTDSQIQTLLFDEVMDATLARIREQVRTSIEESGINPLFCVFGFLEWFEDPNSEVALHAPLLLAPLEIERVLERGHYRYMVRSTGDGAITNAALAVRLKNDFDLKLPEYDDDDTPESYFAAVQKLLSKQTAWKIRRWVTIGLFSFARIAMYHDLDPKKWHKRRNPIESHPIVRKLLGGGDGEGSQAGTITIDGGNGDAEAAGDVETKFPLIADADSSQLLALRDVISRNSLVIEGPPGTGKSQTITNIIATVLSKNLSVLFLAEKMAALNVVKDRLTKAKLGDFCFELHSTKANRKEVFASLKRRLSPVRIPVTRAELKSALSQVDVTRASLRAFVDALGEPAGELGFTIQELLWQLQRLRSETPDLPDAIDELDYPNAHAVNQLQLIRIIERAEKFAEVRQGILRVAGSVESHPWFGVANDTLNPFHADDLVRRTKKLANCVDPVSQSLQEISAIVGETYSECSVLYRIAAVQAIQPPVDAIDGRMLAALSAPEILGETVRFIEDLSEHRLLRETISASFENREIMEQCDCDKLKAVSVDAEKSGLGSISFSEVLNRERKLKKTADEYSSISGLMDQLWKCVGWQEPLSHQIESALLVAADLAGEARLIRKANLCATVFSEGASHSLGHGIERARALLDRKKAAEINFALASAPSSACIRQFASTIRSEAGSPFSLFKKEYRKARSAFRGIWKQSKKVSRIETANLLDDLAQLLDDINEYAQDARLSTYAQGAFSGLGSDLSAHLTAAQWADRVRESLPSQEDAIVAIREFLFTGSMRHIEEFVAIGNSLHFPNLRKAVSSDASARTLAVQAESARSRVEEVGKFVESLRTLGVRNDVPLSNYKKLASQLKKMRKLRQSLDNAQAAKGVLGSQFAGHETNESIVGHATKYVKAVDGANLPDGIRKWLLSGDPKDRIELAKGLAEKARIGLTGLEAVVQSIRTAFPDIDMSAWLGGDTVSDLSIPRLCARLQGCMNDPEGLQNLIDDQRMVADAKADGLGDLISLLEKQGSNFDGLGRIVKRVLFQTIARDGISRAPALARFTGERHEALRSEFRQLDAKLRELWQWQIAGDLLQRSIDFGNNSGPKKDWTGLALIHNEVDKQKGHLRIRDCLQRAGKAVQQLMPCFMMSPLSVAQFLEPGSLKFDLLIIDEASQLRPEEAIGAAARAKQIVVVGDPKQLPPTNFFARIAPLGDGAIAVADEQSILDQAMSILRPVRRLKWHYRSRHESLIAFSNKEFYEDSLVLFPAPYFKHPDYGVKYQFVPDGLYRSSTNRIEAQRVAEAAFEYVKRHPKRSLGIVALNQEQTELINLEIDRMAIEHPEFEDWQKKWEGTLERFFVKNLENVQGDERDTIFISTVYGKDEEGNFHQRFGPINNEGGHRRLNVLFTRAKCQTVVFSSMDPSQLRTDEGSNWGVRALKGYLKYAKDGTLDLPKETGRDPDSDFERAVAAVLRRNGYDAVPQVGVAGYFIDIGVRHPDRPGEFVIGIECDGATYHSTKSARDRDRLRQENLERLKWRIHRIWSLDWYRNARREEERLLRAVRDAAAIYPGGRISANG